MTIEEKNKITTLCEVLISEEVELKSVPEELRLTSREFKSAIPSVVFEMSHWLYHQIEKETSDCALAMNSIVLKIFMLGYNCRKAMEENAKLDTILTASSTQE